MDDLQKGYYEQAMDKARSLALGQRNEDYNKGGIELRDYWEVNGIRSPIQMVDIKIKRALSQVGKWPSDPQGRPTAPTQEQVDAILESMADAINYAAFVYCEAASLHKDIKEVPSSVLSSDGEPLPKREG